MPRADPRHAAGQNLAAFLQELRENVRAFVVDEVHLLHAEFAHFLLAKILPLAAGPSAWARSSSGSGLSSAARRALAPSPAFASRSAA